MVTDRTMNNNELMSSSTHYRSFRRGSSRQSLALVRTTKTNSKINQTNTKKPKYNNILPTYTCTQKPTFITSESTQTHMYFLYTCKESTL